MNSSHNCADGRMARHRRALEGAIIHVLFQGPVGRGVLVLGIKDDQVGIRSH